MENRELKPCPFCGSKAKVFACDDAGQYYTGFDTPIYRGRPMRSCLIRCGKCGVKTKAYLTRRGVFNAWNRRAENGKS